MATPSERLSWHEGARTHSNFRFCLGSRNSIGCILVSIAKKNGTFNSCQSDTPLLRGQPSGTSAGGLLQGASTRDFWNQSSRRFACSVMMIWKRHSDKYHLDEDRPWALRSCWHPFHIRTDLAETPLRTF